jgi:Xaa-Pro aminopeptidase
MNRSSSAHLQALRERMGRERLDGILISRPENGFYIAGFSGDTGYLVVTAERAILFVDSRFTEQAREECPAWEVRQFTRFSSDLAALCRELGLRYIGFESQHLSFSTVHELEHSLTGQLLVPCLDMLERIRSVKDEPELQSLRRAAALGDEALRRALEGGLVGQSEEAIAWRLQQAMHELGATGPSFETIVASGPRAAMPHGVASSKVIEAGEMVLFDWGVMLDHYCSDCTRVIFTAPPSEEQEKVYRAVQACQQAALERIRPGVPSREVAKAAQEVLERSDFAPHAYQHGLGHGVGLQVHEQPRLRMDGEEQTPSVEELLQAGQVVTVEPGVYIPGWGGIRLEDTVLVGEGGPEFFTSFPKTIIIA